MSSRRTKPIRLKALAAHRASEVSEMLAEIEGGSVSRRSKARRSSIWTREFLASGKPGKV